VKLTGVHEEGEGREDVVDDVRRIRVSDMRVQSTLHTTEQG
jgi:hypothetical protein